MEDYLNWDVRITSQLRRSAQAVRLLIRLPPATTGRVPNLNHPQPSSDQARPDFYVDDYAISDPRDPPYGNMAR